METVIEYGRQILSLVVVFTLLGFTVFKFGRKRSSLSLNRFTAVSWRAMLHKKISLETSGPDRVLEKLERIVLTPQHALHVVRLRDREMLLATHPQGCTLLSCSPDAADKPFSLAARAGQG